MNEHIKPSERRVKDVSILLMSVFSNTRSVTEAWALLRRFLRKHFDGYTIPFPLQDSLDDLNFVEDVVVQIYIGKPIEDIKNIPTPQDNLKACYKSIQGRI